MPLVYGKFGVVGVSLWEMGLGSICVFGILIEYLHLRGRSAVSRVEFKPSFCLKKELVLVLKGVLARSEIVGFFDSLGFFGLFGSGLSRASAVVTEKAGISCGLLHDRLLFCPFYGVVDWRWRFGSPLLYFSVTCFAVVSCWYSCCLASAGLSGFSNSVSKVYRAVSKVYRGEGVGETNFAFGSFFCYVLSGSGQVLLFTYLLNFLGA
ncbi:unnamed protein product [Vicia faba]|uniref:Uncharacterized protein n=1 Tax=Vicia faba TaxID=3906 RepID=A0AAV1AIL1_VICFA|nr:unnamed protein product [Vicia faba]